MLKVLYFVIGILLLAVFRSFPNSRLYIIAFAGLGIVAGCLCRPQKVIGATEGVAIGAITGAIAWFLITATNLLDDDM